MGKKAVQDEKGSRKKPSIRSISKTVKSDAPKPKPKKPSAGPKSKIDKPKSKKGHAKTGSSKSPSAGIQAQSSGRKLKSEISEIRRLKSENAELRLRLTEAEETLNAIRTGEVDALVVSGPGGDQVYALKGAEQPYRILVESMNEGALSIMENSVIMNCNRAFADIADSTCGMLVGRKFSDFVSEKDLRKFSAFWKLAYEREARDELELIFDDRTVPVFISASTRLIEGECWYFVVVTDITERKRAEAELSKYRMHLEKMVGEKTEKLQATNEELQTVNEEVLSANKALRESEERFRIIADSTPDHLFVQDRNLRYTLVMNPQMGFTERDMIGKTDHDLLSKENADTLTAIKRKVLETGESVNIELPLKDREGNQQFFDGSYVPKSNAQGKVDGLIGYFRNVTERKKTEEALLRLTDDLAARNLELEALNKELDAFVHSVSHDLRAPLRTVEGFAKIIAEDYANKLDEEGSRHLKRICKGADLMSRLIEDLLRLSQISRQNLNKMNCDLSSIVSSIIFGLQQATPARNVEVVIEEGLRADVDPDLMKIALSNLLANAWKFTSKTENPRIEFGAMKQGSETVYFVKDNGAGFDQTYAQKLFIPFQRLHSDKEFRGTGIGLSIVERIIRRHGGRIWAEGAPGKGATLYFSL